MKSICSIFSFCIILLLFANCSNIMIESISLEGTWQVKLDSTNIGNKENWASTKFDGQNINLPGTLDDAEIGVKSTLEPAMNNYVLSNLTRKYQYIGKAWYQKEIDIPKDWVKENITLSLERIIWESTVFVNGTLIGKNNSLVAVSS